MPTIPLLLLPLLVLEEVLKCLNPIQLFKLSGCSKKMNELIPLGGTKNYKLVAEFSDDLVIVNDRYFFGRPRFFKGISRSRRMHIKGDLINCLLRLRGLFKCGIHSLETRRETDAAKFESLIPIILKNDRLIKSFTLRGTSISAENLKQIFQISESLEICLNFPSLSFKQLANFPKHLNISQSKEFTRSNLLALKQCVSINLAKSRLRNKDLDSFLESWKNVVQEFAGLGGWPRNIDNGSKQKIINNCTVGVHGGETIERVDGVKATIQLYANYDSDEVTQFQFLSDKAKQW